MKKKMRILGAGILLSAVMVMTSYAGSWQRNEKGWWWLEDNGSYPVSTWCWLDGNGDGISECYYFDNNGYMLANTITPDGYQVNGDGAWVDGSVVQTKRRKWYSLEEAEKMALDYRYSHASDPNGTFVIFDEETEITGEYYKFIVRWQMSEKEADYRIKNDLSVAPNIYSGKIYVDYKTGNIWEEW